MAQASASRSARHPARAMRASLDVVAAVSDPIREGGMGSLFEAAQTRRTYPLHDAAKRGDYERVKSMIADGADPNALNTRRYAPLMWMLQRAYGSRTQLAEKHALTIRALAEGGADINAPGGQHSATALHLAASIGHKSLIEFLVRLGADVNARNFKGETPIDYARSGWLAEDTANDVASFLVSLGATDPNAAVVEAPDNVHDAMNAAPAIAETSAGLSVRLAEFLKANEASLRDSSNAEAIQRAVDILREFDAGAADPANHDAGLAEVMGASAEFSAEDEAERRNKADAVLHAVVNGRTDDVADMISTGKAHPDQVDSSGETLLHYAARSGQAGVMQLLLSAGADASKASLTGQTPLHCAQNVAVAELLINAGADVNAISDKGCGYTPLDLAYQPERDGNLAEFLMSHGAETIDQMD